ncbi:MAG: sodium:solute symporter [Proteobacteria bacterium]|jgi:SSS family solute:Na+ symporter|nr:sodium:solute symporter [Pseudomonadota bacterium]MDA1299849.1 sodium:solute symporter [Pseudomonadota bacterium]
MTLGTVDAVVLGGYFLILILMGGYFARKNVSTDEYFLGGRRFAGWVIGLSLVGTSISSITFLAYPGDAFKTSWLRFLPNLMLPLAVIIAARYFLPRLRGDKTITAYEFLEHRFGPSIRVYGSLAFIVAQVVRVSLILYLISLVLQQITGMSAPTCIVIAGCVVAIYTVLGGIDAVIWTDVLQTIVLLAGGIVTIAVIIDLLPGGLAQIFEVAQHHGKLSFSELENGELRPVSWSLSLSEKTASMMLLIGLVSWLTEYSSNQNTVQRFNAARSAEEAKRAMYICAAVSLPVWAFFMFLGTALFVFFEVFPTIIATEILDGTRKAEEILPYFVLHYLPAGVVGLVLAAALAAAMSSLDSSINAISTTGVTDLYRRHLQSDASDRHYLLVARGIGCAVGVTMIGGALYLNHTETTTLQDTATILTSLLAGGLLAIYAIGFFSDRGDARHVAFGIGGTMLFTAWTIASSRELLPSYAAYPFDLYYTGLIGNLVMFGLAFGLALVVPNMLPHRIHR